MLPWATQKMLHPADHLDHLHLHMTHNQDDIHTQHTMMLQHHRGEVSLPVISHKHCSACCRYGPISDELKDSRPLFWDLAKSAKLVLKVLCLSLTQSRLVSVSRQSSCQHYCSRFFVLRRLTALLADNLQPLPAAKHQTTDTLTCCWHCLFTF